MGIEEFAEEFLKAHDEAVSSGDFSKLETLEDSDIVQHIVTSGIDIIGWKSHKEHIISIREGLSNIECEYKVLVSDTALFAIQYKIKGLFTGQMAGWPPPNGKEITAISLTLFRVVNSKVAESWTHSTVTGFNQ